MQHIAVACDRIQTQRAAHISTQSTQQGPAQQTAKAAVLAATAERPVAAAAAAAADAANHSDGQCRFSGWSQKQHIITAGSSGLSQDTW